MDTNTKQNHDGSVTHSVALADLSLDQLVGLQQHLGRQADQLRRQRAHLAAKIAERLQAGERNGPAGGDATAPGATIEVGAA